MRRVKGPLAGRRVLVVEDETLVLILIEDMLEELGCTSVMTAATADQALELIASSQPDVATVDMNLNGDRTFAVAEALDSAGVPFLFATGYAGRRPKKYVDRPVLAKPFGAPQLEALLADLLSRT